VALLGSAAMLLWFDIVPEHIPEHDEWHTREHLPERVGIPGFIRSQRWVSPSSSPRYLVVHEVRDIDVLSSAPYLERLNNPTPWTRWMMPHYRGMVRGFCQLDRTFGTVLGTTSVTVRYSATPGAESRLREWLEGELIADLMRRQGITSAFMLRSDRAPEMTAEQRIRGRDADVDLVLLVTGYSLDTMAELAQRGLGAKSVEAHGALPGTASTSIFQLACLSSANP
jgi:hypothetical protein